MSPYSWLPAWTPKEQWLGGFTDKVGRGGTEHGLCTHAFQSGHDGTPHFIGEAHVTGSAWRQCSEAVAVAVAILARRPLSSTCRTASRCGRTRRCGPSWEVRSHITAQHSMAQHSVCFGGTVLSSGLLVLVAAAGCECFPLLPARRPRQLLQLLSTCRLPQLAVVWHPPALLPPHPPLPPHVQPTSR